MSLLDGLDDGLVSGEFFTTRNWMYKNLPHFTGYFKAHLTMVKLPQDSEMSPFNFKVIYIPESRILTIDTYDVPEYVAAKWGVKFEGVRLQNVTESEIIVALSPVFLSSRFVKV
jgi:hypothetical protein